MAVVEVRFSVPGEPEGKGRPRFSTGYSGRGGRAFVRVHTPMQTVNYENLVKVEYENAARGFMFPDNAMLDMRIVAYYGVPKSDSKKKREQKLNGEIRPTKKPDADNVVKSVADALNGIAYKDDTQIVDCQIRKFYSDKPRVEVRIIEIERKEQENVIRKDV